MNTHVSVSINGRQYRMACEDGQEAHLAQLAQDLDARIQELRTRFGEIGDIRLAVMAALTVADELVEAGTRLDRLEHQIGELQAARTAAMERSQTTKTAIAAALDAAAERIERVTKTLKEERHESEPLPLG
jgi:cell division protein ZapA